MNQKTSPPFLYSNSVIAGFPSPAEGEIDRALDLNELLISNPPATYFVRVTGNSMKDCGIFDGDILIVDRSLTATNNKIIIAYINNEFTVKRLKYIDNKIFLYAENEEYPPIKINSEENFEIFGVVTYVIHSL